MGMSKLMAIKGIAFIIPWFFHSQADAATVESSRSSKSKATHYSFALLATLGEILAENPEACEPILRIETSVRLLDSKKPPRLCLIRILQLATASSSLGQAIQKRTHPFLPSSPPVPRLESTETELAVFFMRETFAI